LRSHVHQIFQAGYTWFISLCASVLVIVRQRPTIACFETEARSSQIQKVYTVGQATASSNKPTAVRPSRFRSHAKFTTALNTEHPSDHHRLQDPTLQPHRTPAHSACRGASLSRHTKGSILYTSS